MASRRRACQARESSGPMPPICSFRSPPGRTSPGKALWHGERPGPVPRDPADAGATIRLNRLIGKLQGLTVVGPASAGGDQLFRLAPLPGFQVTPRDFGLDASTAGFMGSMGVMATADGTPSGLVLDAGWPESPTSDTGPGISSSWHLEVSMSESEPTQIGPPRNRWPSFASERDGYRIAYPPSWSVAKCKVGGLIGRCLSAGNGSEERRVGKECRS